VSAHIYGSILKGARGVDVNHLLMVVADVLFPHSDVNTRRPSQYQFGTLSQADLQIGKRLADRYTQLTRNSNNITLFTVDGAVLAQHMAKLVRYMRVYSTSNRVSNRLRAYAYLYDQWCHGVLLNH
jgi:hypothetical protein